MTAQPYSAAFLDRDGTLVVERDRLGDPAEVHLVAGAAAAVTRLNQRDIPVVVVTNQSGIGRGHYSRAEYEAVEHVISERLGAHGARLDAVYHCPHDPAVEPCECRKPAPGLFERAGRDLGGIALDRALFVGDQLRDVSFGLSVGARTFLVLSGHPLPDPLPPGVELARDLAAAVDRALTVTR